METYNLNNLVKIGGYITTNLEFSHEIFDEKFYKFFVEVERISDTKDVLPVIISERIFDVNNFKKGITCLIEGQFRSYNQISEEKSKLVLSIFAKSIEINVVDVAKQNEIVLEGFICKTPIYRKTPLGREISDVLVAVNRSYKKSDYIPCILWGRNAKFSENLEVGTKIKLVGRIQGRNYEKNINGEIIKQTAYEISVSKFGLIEEINEGE